MTKCPSEWRRRWSNEREKKWNVSKGRNEKKEKLKLRIDQFHHALSVSIVCIISNFNNNEKKKTSQTISEIIFDCNDKRKCLFQWSKQGKKHEKLSLRKDWYIEEAKEQLKKLKVNFLVNFVWRQIKSWREGNIRGLRKREDCEWVYEEHESESLRWFVDLSRSH